MAQAKDVAAELRALADKEKAALLQRFFKTAPGQYGHGDIFLGIQVPQLRKIAKKYGNLTAAEVTKLVKSPIHEHRFVALKILVIQYQKGSLEQRNKVASFYLKHKKFVNNWDLVDTSAPYILGDYLLDQDKTVLYKLAKSKNLWDKRIAIISTFGFIRRRKFDDALRLAEILLPDTHDLIHKAVGWMLREIGKQDLAVEKTFLAKHYRAMPRTMLRYAIEKFPEKSRQAFLKGTA